MVFRPAEPGLLYSWVPRDVAIESTLLALASTCAHRLSTPLSLSLSLSPLLVFQGDNHVLLSSFSFLPSLPLSLSLILSRSSCLGLTLRCPHTYEPTYALTCASSRVYVTYLRSYRLSLSSTPVTVTNDALSIRIVRREGENGEHLLAPYPSWRQPHQLLRPLPSVP